MVNVNTLKKKKTSASIPEVRYNLKSLSDLNKPTLIRAVFRYNSKKFVYSTRINIAPKNWNSKKQSPKSAFHFYADIKGQLDKITFTIHKVYKEFLDADKLDILDFALFKEHIDSDLGRIMVSGSNEDHDLLSYIELYIEQIKQDPKANFRTAQKYLTLYNNLLSFRPGKIPFNAITEDFWEQYSNWRYNNTRTKSQNTLNKDLSCLKLIMRKSHRKKLHDNTIYQDPDFSVKIVKTSTFSLSEDEVRKVYEWDFTGNKRLERVRDWFIISCYTALRYSDFTTLKPEHIIRDGNDYYLKKDTIKTDEPVVIPIDEELYRLLLKYEFKGIDISNQKFNMYLKEVFEIAGITDTTIMKENIKGIQVEKTYRKCDIISAHCGRRTWATINYLMGRPIGLLMQVTGHTKESTFLSYVGASNLDKARKLRQLMGLSIKLS